MNARDPSGPPDQPAPQPAPVAGVIVIDKPLGRTSMSACEDVKYRLRAGGLPKSLKVGHGGTLDPLATGVLVILVGKLATKHQNLVMAGEKTYRAAIDLAHTSPTDDLEVPAVPVPDIHPVDESRVREICTQFVGRIQQVPPAHSAMLVGGQRAYDLARRGKDPGLQARPVDIHDITVISYAWPTLVIDVRCGKGTYIRSLARDIGKALNVGGVLTALRRTRVGEFTESRARSLATLPAILTPAHLDPLPHAWLPPAPEPPADPEPYSDAD